MVGSAVAAAGVDSPRAGASRGPLSLLFRRRRGRSSERGPTFLLGFLRLRRPGDKRAGGRPGVRAACLHRAFTRHRARLVRSWRIRDASRACASRMVGARLVSRCAAHMAPRAEGRPQRSRLGHGWTGGGGVTGLRACRRQRADRRTGDVDVRARQSLRRECRARFPRSFRLQ